MVSHMGWVISRPWLTAIEVAWRWIFAVPFLLICWVQLQHILVQVPLASSGLNAIDAQNPWIAAGQFQRAWALYAPYLAALIRWLALPAAAAWIMLSGLGRSLILSRLDSASSARLPLRPFAMMAIQATWLLLLAATWFGWFESMAWVASTHITPNAEPDLIGYAFWAIFLALGFFTLWALVSWPLTIAPTLLLREKRSAFSAIFASLHLGRELTGKLVEINLVMGIVNLALIVLAMVFSAAPLPFSDELGSDALHTVSALAIVFYLVASDYFQVVRLRAFQEFWKLYRSPAA